MSTDDLNRRIIRSVTEYWETNRVPLLLSRLGLQDDGEISKLTRQYSSSLREYLERHLSDQVRVVQHQSKSQLVGAIPMGVDLLEEGGGDILLEKTQSKTANTVLRFHPAFWAAFRKPIDKCESRFISIHEPVRFRDSASAEKPDGFVEIQREYIVGPEADSNHVQQAAQDWLDRSGIESRIYLSSGKSTEQPRDLLDRLLDTLETSELERVTMPLDVVSKLRRQSP